MSELPSHDKAVVVAYRKRVAALIEEAYELGHAVGEREALLHLHSRSPKISVVQRVVADHFGIDVCEMTSSRRAQPAALVRQVAMYLCRDVTPHSLPMIGRYFGGRDHTTVWYAIRKVTELASSDPDFGERVASLRERLKPAEFGGRT